MQQYLQPVTDHTEIAQGYLLEQYKGRPKIEALLEAIILPIQSIEDESYKMYLQGLISVAEGVYLDRLGAIVGVERKARSDKDYRFAINIGITANNSGATPEDIIAVVRNTYMPDKIRYFEHGTAYFELFLKLDTQPSNISILLNSLKPAGVGKPVVIYTDSDDIFSFSERVTEIVQAEIDEKSSISDLQVADTSAILADLELVYDGFKASKATNGFAEIIITRPDLLLDDDFEYTVDNSDNLEMLLSFEDFIIEGGSPYVEVTSNE